MDEPLMVVGARYWDGMSWLALVNAPTGFLDVRLQAQLPGLLRGPVRNPGLSLIIATHDLAKMNGGRGRARAQAGSRHSPVSQIRRVSTEKRCACAGRCK
ncbi:MAG: hypothetical protein IPL38_02775 [Rhodobacter sp.]|nr:hypothetical protein [Rhodobacter sp.]